MAAGGLTVLDGTRLRSLNLSSPELNAAVTGAQLLEIANSKVSASLFGLSLPENIKASAVSCVIAGSGVDDVTFRKQELAGEKASKVLSDYITAIADQLKDYPLVVSILDGNTLKLFLEDEDDYAMLAENLFTDLDIEDKGKICKSEIRNALLHMGVEMGIPPFSEFPLLNDILKKHGAEGEEELGQAQFAELLQPILQETADALAEKNVVVIQNIEVVNGSKLRKLLADEKQFNNVIQRVLEEKKSRKDDLGKRELIRSFLEKHGKDLGLPPVESNEAVILLYDSVFPEVESKQSDAQVDDGFREYVKDILEKFAEQLEANPVYCELDN
ncbi:putative calcium ion binding protein [Corchorus olitorius]|uniref:Calcium ion binding protein n=1 Tax=Corchorus olitorius TaxID=93759 RepID=A0A1R3JN68_9ROSI|nr:putative calcium ion binding protein [Corchorus olitorius]